MSRYSLNLNEKKSSSKTNLLIFIGVFIISLILIFSISHLVKPKKKSAVIKKTITKKETTKKIEKVKLNQTKQKKVEKIVSKPSKKKTTKPIKRVHKKIVKKPKERIVKPKKIKKRILSNISFKNDINGAKITGVALAKGISPTVFIKQNGATKTYHIGDSFENHKIKEIHRTYILLTNGAKVIHLNYLQ